MLVVPGLHQIPLGRDIVNAFVWERDDGGLTLIDAGMPGDSARILDYLATLGANRLDRIVITHGDIDHAGGLAAIQAATRARVVCHAVEKGLIEGRERRPMRKSPLGAIYSPLFEVITRRVLHYHPLSRVDELVVDKQVLPEGFQVVHTPGHSAGHIALFHPGRGILIAGDALRNDGNQLKMPMAIATPHMDIARESVVRLAGLKGVQVIGFGHGPAITERAAERLQAFAASFPAGKA